MAGRLNSELTDTSRQIHDKYTALRAAREAEERASEARDDSVEDVGDFTSSRLHEGTVTLGVKIPEADDVQLVESSSYKRSRIIRRAGFIAAGFLVVGGAAAVATAAGDKDLGADSPFAAMLSPGKSVIDGGYTIDTLPNQPVVAADIAVDTPVYFGVTVTDADNPEVQFTGYISDNPEVTGEGSYLPSTYKFPKQPFGEPDGETVTRTPVARLINTIGFGFDDKGLILEAVEGKPDTVRVARNQLPITTFMPEPGDPGAPDEAFNNYEAPVPDPKMFPDGYVSGESFEVFASFIDGDRSTPDVVDKNPVITNGHRAKILEELKDQACYADIATQLDAHVVEFVKSQLRQSEGADVDVELVGAYGSPDARYKEVLGDDQPTVDGEGDESRYSGDFMFGPSSVVCDDVRESSIFEAYMPIDAKKGDQR